MAINYTLNINSVKKRLTQDEFSNVIIEASFSVFASSDTVTTTDDEGNVVVITPAFSYSCGGTKAFSVDGLDTDNFVDFENVTKDTVVQWLLAEEGVTSIEDFSYVKSSVQNIAQRIYEYGLEVPENIIGEDLTGTSDYVYTPLETPTPTPAPEVILPEEEEEEVVETPIEPIA